MRQVRESEVVAPRTPDVGRRPRVLSTYVASVTVTTAGMLPVLLVGTLAVQIRDSLGLSTGDIAVLVAVFFLASSGASVVARELFEHARPRGLLLAAGGLSTACLVSAAVLSTGLLTLGASILLGAFAAAVSTPATNDLVAVNLPPGRQGIAHGIKQAAIPLSGMLAGLAVPTVGLTLGWRWSFALAALVPALGVIASWRSTQAWSDRHDGRGRAPRGEGRPGTPRALWYLTIGVGFAAAAITSVHSFAILSSTAAGLEEGVAGIFVAVGSVVVIFIRVGAGARADRVRSNRLVAVAVMLAASIGGYLVLMTGRAMLMGPGTVITLAFGWGWPGLLTLAVVELYPDRPAAATGTVMAAIYMGGVVGPLLFAAIESAGGYGPAWVAMAGLAAVASGMVHLGSRTSARG
jgi:predicted MFS family arabinose efflux permease